MSNKFNEFGAGGDSGSVTNGSLDIYGFSLKAENLDANQPLKTNSDKQLVSTLLNISDVVNLQAELDSSIQNPNQSVLVTDGLDITSGNQLRTNNITGLTSSIVNVTNIECSGDVNSAFNVTSDRLGTNLLVNQTGTGTLPVGVASDLNLDAFNNGNKKNISNADNIETQTLNVNSLSTLSTVNAVELNVSLFITSDRCATNLLVNQSGTGTIPIGVATDLNFDAFNNGNNKDITNVGNLKCGALTCLTLNTEEKSNRITSNANIRMLNNDITEVDQIDVDNITSITNPQVNVLKNLDMNSNNIESVNSLTTNTLNVNTFQTVGFSIQSQNNIDMTNNNLLNVANVNCTNVNTNTSNSATVSTQILNGGISPDISVNANLNLNDNDIRNAKSMTMTNTQYISSTTELNSPVIAGAYVIPDNTTWLILGTITFDYPIRFGVNCSLRGMDFSSTIIFDETNRDCDIHATDNNFYLSQLTIVNGGGRFTNNLASVRGLLNATNYNVSAPAPFYGRNKRFKVTDVNILRPFKIGTVEGFGTLNITNNFFNGGGGLAGQVSNYYTNEGLSISDGLSLEFNNNKVVLMAGAQQASTLKMLSMKARVSSLLGFNAVTITGNIFHPRNAETGIDFDADSRTQLGNISGNVFIRTGGTSPLINYTDQPTYDNYNVDSVRNYNINANTGIVDSEPTLKSGFGTSEIITTASYEELEFTNNAQVLPITESSRFCIQLDLTGVSTAFVANERITDTASSNTALIMSVDAESGGNQSVYVLDMSGSFNATPTTFTSVTGSASGGALRMRYKYLETDPRKLTLNMSITFTTDENKDEETTFAPGDGTTPDTDCEVPINTRNDAVGGHLTLICVRRWTTGDIINFYAKTADATTEMNIIKALVAIN